MHDVTEPLSSTANSAGRRDPLPEARDLGATPSARLMVVGRARPRQLALLIAVIGVIVGLSAAVSPSLGFWTLTATILVALLFSFVRYPMLSTLALVGGASFIAYSQLNTARLFIGDVPINVMDILMLATVPVLIRIYVRRPSVNGRVMRWHGWTLVSVGILLAMMLVAAIRGIGEGQVWYNVARASRPILFLVATALLVRGTIQTEIGVYRVFAVVGAGGLASLIIVLAQRLQLLANSTGNVFFLDVRTSVAVTPAMDFTSALIPALLVVTRPTLRLLIVLWCLYALVFSANLVSLSLTGAVVAVFVPLLTAAVGATRTVRRSTLFVGASPLLLFAAIAIGAMALPSDRARNLVQQSVTQVLAITESPNLRGRVVSWETTASRVRDDWAIGLGLGYREFIDTGVRYVGPVLLGEPTAATMLLATGAIGAVALVSLLLSFVARAFFLYLQSAPGSLRAGLALTLTVYGVTTTLSAFLHNTLLSPQGSVLFGALLGTLDVMAISYRSQSNETHDMRQLPLSRRS